MSSSASDSSEEEIVESETRSRVFQMKVIERARAQNVDSESDHDTEDIEPVSHKKSKIQICDETCNELQTEQDAIEIQKQHEKFMEAQMKKAEQFVKRGRKLVTVSSKLPVVETDTCRPGMEGRGPRHVPQSVKNYRKKLKKKHSRTKEQHS